MTNLMKNIKVISVFVFFIILAGFPAMAGDFHKPPKDFMFGNHIDTHQENMLLLIMGVREYQFAQDWIIQRM